MNPLWNYLFLCQHSHLPSTPTQPDPGRNQLRLGTPCGGKMRYNWLRRVFTKRQSLAFSVSAKPSRPANPLGPCSRHYAAASSGGLIYGLQCATLIVNLITQVCQPSPASTSSGIRSWFQTAERVGVGQSHPARGTLLVPSPSSPGAPGSMAGCVTTGFQAVVLEHLLSASCMQGTLAQELANLALRMASTSVSLDLVSSTLTWEQ